VRRATIHSREFDGQDDLQSVIERRPAAGDVGCVLVCRQPLQEMRPGRLRQDCLESAGLIDRLTVLARTGEGEWLAAHLYRHRTAGGYTPDEVEAGAGIARLVAGCMARHYLCDPTGVATLRGRVSEGVREFGNRLTEREREVLTRILDGVTVNRIAEDLKLRPTTVATYRLRAYEKLGVTSRQELFAAILKRRPAGPERSRPANAPVFAQAAHPA
jgi:DNA-binding CsgD family transcriptional regulator